MAYPKEFKIISDYRESREGIDELALSIEQNGLYQPIVVVPHEEGEVKYEVVAGRRRFRAMTEYLKFASLKKGEHFVVKEGIDALLAQFQENFNRKDFSPIELGRLIKAIHAKKIKENGLAIKGREGGWGLKDTGKLIGRDSAFVSRMISIADNEDKVADCGSVSEALEKISKTKSKDLQSKVRKARVSIQESETPPGLEELISCISNTDALSYVKSLEDDSIDLVLTDPPYAINYDKIVSTDEYECYEDDPETIKNLLESLIPEYYRVIKQDKYVIIWTAYEWYYWLREKMIENGFRIAATPIHWVKLNSTGRSMNPNKTLGSLCEIAVYGWKGDGELALSGKGNTFPVQIVRSDRIHVAQKPDQLLKDILPIFTIKNDTVLDTFGGSLSLLRACFETGRKCKICELDQTNIDNAVTYTRDMYKEEKDGPTDS